MFNTYKDNGFYRTSIFGTWIPYSFSDATVKDFVSVFGVTEAKGHLFCQACNGVFKNPIVKVSREESETIAKSLIELAFNDYI